MRQCYEFDPDNVDIPSHPYSKVLSQEVYSGDFSIRLHAQKEKITFDRGACEVIPIFYYSSRVDTALRRGRRHIRETARQAYALWVLEKGSIRITTSSGSQVIEARSIVITDSGSPFLAEALVGDGGVNEHYLAVVPAHIFHAHVASLPDMNGVALPASQFDGSTVTNLVSLLYKDGRLDPSSYELLRAALRSLARLLNEKSRWARARNSVRDTRLASIQALIGIEMSDPDLSMAKVAARCRISERYLSQIMKDAGETFAEALRRNRLTTAHEWLTAPERRHMTITEVGQLTGFRSGTQFSRAFRAFYGVTPREVRASITH